MLLAYLGENETHRCGTCDVCLERNKLELSDLEFTNVKEQVKSMLAEGELPLEKILTNIKGTNEDKALKVVQWLIDNDKVIYTKGNKLTYHID